MGAFLQWKIIQTTLVFQHERSIWNSKHSLRHSTIDPHSVDDPHMRIRGANAFFSTLSQYIASSYTKSASLSLAAVAVLWLLRSLTCFRLAIRCKPVSAQTLVQGSW